MFESITAIAPVAAICQKLKTNPRPHPVSSKCDFNYIKTDSVVLIPLKPI